MWFWQRREVYMGKDGPQLYAVRTALEQAGIGFEYIVRSGRNYTCLLYTSDAADDLIV